MNGQVEGSRRHFVEAKKVGRGVYGVDKMITFDQARELLGDFVEDDDEPS